MVTISTANLTINNSTFCPHTEFMCFMWIWEQTAVISLYSMVCITETESVYCAVRTGYLNAIHFNVACHHGAQIRSQAAVWEFFRGKVLLVVFRFSPVCVNPPLLRVCFHVNVTVISWSLTLREEVLRRLFGPKRDEVTSEWGKLHNAELRDLYSLPNIVRVVKSRRMRWAGHVARMGRGQVCIRF